jgi:hypothetical protein
MTLIQDNPAGALVRVGGTPTTAGAYSFTLQLSDAAGATASRAFSATVPQPGSTTGPATPTLLTPADGASVTTPFTISWSAEIDPIPLNGGYNWQVSTSSTFGATVLENSTRPNATQAIVSGLPAGAYFWRVQAVDSQLRSSTFSAPRGFTVTGATPEQPGSSVISLPPYGNSFHPFESFGFTWTPAQGAVTYEFLASKNSAFPPDSIKFDNITATSRVIVIGSFCGGCEQGTYFARVVAIGANGIRGIPSNTVSFTISYNAPLPPAPTALVPANGATVSLPFTLGWSDVPNPQDTGYEVEISRNSSFTDIEEHIPQLTAAERQVLSLTSGTKFWRVRSHQGMASETVTAFTAWSATRSFTIADTAAAVQSVWLGAPPCQNPCPGADSLFSGQEINGSIQLATAAPAGGAVVSLVSNPASGASHPATVTIPAGIAFTTFRLFAGEVSTNTPVTLTASLGSSSAAFAFTVKPTSVKALSFCCDSTSGLPAEANLAFTGVVPVGGATVTFSSSSAVATPPATVTVPAGAFNAPISIPTTPVTQTTNLTISATYNGTTVSAPLTLYPQQAPTTLVLDRAETTGTQGASGTVGIAASQGHVVQMQLTSSRPDIAKPSAFAQIGIFGVAGAFTVTTVAPAAPTVVTITAQGAGVTLSTTLTVNPVAAPPPPPSAATDTVAVQRAEYNSGKLNLRLDATSTSSTATLKAYVTSTGALLGTLTNAGAGRYSGQLTSSTNPQNITVKSSLGGSASRTVVLK